jgi:SAM-dependent methyltransferase
MSEDVPAGLPEDKPSAARIYDYLLGGYQNFEVDRAVAKKFMEIMPSAPSMMRVNRAFLRRVVRFLVDQGVEQFLDIGSGIPTVGNVHEIAQNMNPSTRVVYVDADSVAVRHSEAILEGVRNTVVIEANASQPEAILNHPEVQRVLDFHQPIAVLIVSVLLFITDDEEAYRLVRVLRDALVPGSYLAISHGTNEGGSREQLEQSVNLYAATPNPVKLRSHTQIERFFNGFELIEPGLVYLPAWRPEGPEDLWHDEPEMALSHGGVGRKL